MHLLEPHYQIHSCRGQQSAGHRRLHAESVDPQCASYKGTCGWRTDHRPRRRIQTQTKPPGWALRPLPRASGGLERYTPSLNNVSAVLAQAWFRAGRLGRFGTRRFRVAREVETRQRRWQPTRPSHDQLCLLRPEPNVRTELSLSV